MQQQRRLRLRFMPSKAGKGLFFYSPESHFAPWGQNFAAPLWDNSLTSGEVYSAKNSPVTP